MMFFVSIGPGERLSEARDAFDRAVTQHGWGSPEVEVARSQVATAQRDLAADQGLPYAEPFDLGVKWATGAPLPHLVSGHRTFVAFYLSRRNPGFDGTNPRMRRPDVDEGIGVVEFVGATAVKMGPPNDEVLRGHPLWERGLQFYTPHLVHNSPWLREIVDINRVHDRFNEERWRDTNHYLFTFQDEILECIANGTLVRVEPGTMSEVVGRLAAEAVR